jgi:hypothetical protein
MDELVLALANVSLRCLISSDQERKILLTGATDDARSMAQAGLALDPTYTVRRFRVGAATDNSTYLLQREHIYEGMHMAGVPAG